MPDVQVFADVSREAVVQWAIVVGAVGTAAAGIAFMWRKLVRPAYRAIRSFLEVGRDAYHVILGEDGEPDLRERLVENQLRVESLDRSVGSLRSDVAELRNQVSGRRGVKARIDKLERSIAVIASEERADIKRALHAVLHHHDVEQEIGRDVDDAVERVRKDHEEHEEEDE